MKGAAATYDDPYRVYEICEGIYWVGFADRQAGFSNNPYLLVKDGEAALIDPGSLLHYHLVAKKVLTVVRPEQITTIIVQHQDPDLCASIPRFEALIEHPIRVVVHPRAALFMPYYGVTSELVQPDDGETLTIAGRRLQFIYTPYVHFAGATMTWDAASGTLFASDVFGAFSKHWQLYADRSYFKHTRVFIEPFVGSQAAWDYAVRRTRELKPKRLCPQHGSIIEDHLEEYLDAVAEFRVGRMLPENMEKEEA